MGKVVTSQGLQDFVQEGKVTHVPDHKPKSNGAAKPEDAAKPYAKPESKPTDSGASQAKESSPTTDVSKAPEAETPPEDDGLTEDERKEISERIRKIVSKKHREMKEAQEAAAESDRFAETQYNERKLADSRAQALEERVKELQAKAAPPPPEEKPPSISDFKDAQGNIDWEKFTEAKADHAAKKAVAAYEAKQQEERAKLEAVEVERRVKASADAARKTHKDFDEVMGSVKGTAADTVPQYMLNYLSESENAGEIAYYLAKHPEESVRIAKLSPIRGLAEMGKLEERLTKPPEKPAPSPPERGGTPPPAPITPLSGEGTVGVNTDPAKMSYKELRAYERARARSRN